MDSVTNLKLEKDTATLDEPPYSQICIQLLHCPQSLLLRTRLTLISHTKMAILCTLYIAMRNCVFLTKLRIIEKPSFGSIRSQKDELEAGVQGWFVTLTQDIFQEDLCRLASFLFSSDLHMTP